MSKKELETAEKNFKEFEENINSLTLDRMNEAPKLEVEPQTKLSQKDLEKSTDIYLKPKRSIAGADKFNEKFRDQYNFSKEYVQFIAENHEIIGESLDLWTKPYAGVPAEEWIVPTNKPLWGPRYLAEQISRAKYHRLVMKESSIIETNSVGHMYGQMVADTTIQRLDAIPVNNKRKSVFMGAKTF